MERIVNFVVNLFRYPTIIVPACINYVFTCLCLKYLMLCRKILALKIKRDIERVYGKGDWVIYDEDGDLIYPFNVSD